MHPALCGDADAVLAGLVYVHLEVVPGVVRLEEALHEGLRAVVGYEQQFAGGGGAVVADVPLVGKGNEGVGRYRKAQQAGVGGALRYGQYVGLYGEGKLQRVPLPVGALVHAACGARAGGKTVAVAVLACQGGQRGDGRVLKDDGAAFPYQFVVLNGEIRDAAVGGFDVPGDERIGVDQARVEFAAFENRYPGFRRAGVRKDDPTAYLPAVQVEIRVPVR